MVSPSIFVSAIGAGAPQQEVELGYQLIEDLEHAGVKVFADDGSVPDSQFLSILQPALRNCTWFILIQTAPAMNSLRVQVAMSTALQQVRQHTMRGIIRILCPSTERDNTPPLWSDTHEIPFTGDYPRVRDKILLELDLLNIDDVVEKAVTKIPTSPLSSLQSAGPQANQLAKMKDIPATMIAPPANAPLRPLNIPGNPFVQPRNPPYFNPNRSDRPHQSPPSSGKSSSLTSVAIIVFALLFILALTGALVIPRLANSSRSALTPNPTQQVTPGTIALDTFHRANQLHWGNASDGQKWEGDASTTSYFSIANGTGKIQGTANAINYTALLGPSSQNSDVTMTFTINELKPMQNKQNGEDIGIILRWQGPDRWYKAFIDGTQLMINKHVGQGNSTTIGQCKMSAQPGKKYTIHFRITGNTLLAEVWPGTQSNQKIATATAKDSSLTQGGQAGLRATLMPTTTVNIFSFQETRLTP